MSITSTLGIATAALVAGLPATAAETTDRSPVVYVIPLSGQMGTDIHPSIYEEVIEDERGEAGLHHLQARVRRLRQELPHPNDDRSEAGIMAEHGGLSRPHDGAPTDFPSTSTPGRSCGSDAVGVSSLLAMSWPEIYMSDGARLEGINTVQQFTRAGRTPTSARRCTPRGSASRPASRRPADSRSSFHGR